MQILKTWSKYGILFVVCLIFLLFFTSDKQFDNKESTKAVGFHLALTMEHNLKNEVDDLKKSKDRTILLVFWTTFFGSKPRHKDGKQYKWPFYYVGGKCPVKCELTTEQHRIAEASAVVFHARDFNQNDLPPKNFRGLPWILHSHENPVYTPVLHDSDVMSKFNYFLSYRLDSDFPSPEFIKPNLSRPMAFTSKTKLILAVYSNCEGLRTHYMSELKKYIKVDFYGNCLRTHKFVKRTSDADDRTLINLMRTYKFTLVFPNADCDYYVTEKMYRALSSGSVPVWLGTDKIDEFLKWGNLNHSIIKVKQFKSPKSLANYLNFLAQNEMEYNKYLKWKYEGFQFPPSYYKSAIGSWWEGLPVYCRVCMKIAQDSKGHDGLPIDICLSTGSERLAKLIP